MHTNQDELLRLFGAEIAGAAQAMLAGPRGEDGRLLEVSIAPLRGLQEQAERYLQIATIPRTRFLFFFLSAFLQDVFYNLAGDVPYQEESQRRRQEFFLALPESLRKFSVAIAADSTGDAIVSCQQMVSEYLDTVTRINKLLERE